MTMAIPFIPRFIAPADLPALSNMWALSATAVASHPERYHRRLVWTAKHFQREHRPDVPETAIYKDLTAMLEHGR